MTRLRRTRTGVAAAFVAGLAIATAGTATAAHLITGKDIKNGTIAPKDLTRPLRAQVAEQPKAGPPGAQGPQGVQGPSGVPAQGFYGANPAQVDLPGAGDDVTLISLGSLPPGSYLLSGHTAAVNYGVPSYVRCGIRAAGTNSFGSSGLGSATAVGNAASFSVVAQVYVSLAVTSTGTSTAELFCRQTGGGVDAYVEESRLMAVRVGEVGR